MFYANEFLFIDGNGSRRTQQSQLSSSLDIIMKLVMKVKVSNISTLTVTATHSRKKNNRLRDFRIGSLWLAIGSSCWMCALCLYVL